ncbi:hypothetical protein [Pseudomonas sp. RL_15y_Pfl2_60]|uniref:hypothetical protein n=1 Tax=Pseudomonas sp. RL_15y_Pfl2_60 TaxID=3088709 RepID=UPI0030D88630
MPTSGSLYLCAVLLRRGRLLDRLSTALSLVALLLGLAPLLGFPTSVAQAMLCAALITLGLLEKYWAARVEVDAELFSHMSQKIGQLTERTAELDQALEDLGLQQSTAIQRTWTDRSKGALRLLRNQGLCLIGQCTLALLTIVSLPWLLTH